MKNKQLINNINNKPKINNNQNNGNTVKQKNNIYLAKPVPTNGFQNINNIFNNGGNIDKYPAQLMNGQNP